MSTSSRHYKAVFISPHLDDAVFSCAGALSLRAKEGPVLVLNIFSKYLGDFKNHGIVLTEERYQEEATAAQSINFESYNLHELDASVRHKPYQSIGSIFHPAIQADIEWIPTLRKKIFSELEKISFEYLYVPLGIGWHVDHMLTYLVFEEWAHPDQIIYYEDTPYCLFPHATRLRIAEIGQAQVDSSDQSFLNTSFFSSWKETISVYSDSALIKNLKPWLVRKAALPVVSFYLYQLMSFHDRLAAKAPETQWVPSLLPLSDADLAAKVESIFIYQSQAKEFFLSPQDCSQLLKNYARAINPLHPGLERTWKAQKKRL